MRRYLLVLAAVLTLAAGIRLYFLSTESIDGDETFTRNVVALPMADSLERIRQDLVHPPLYYLSLKAFTAAFGSGLAAIRTPSLIFSLSGIAALGLLYRRQEWRAPAALAALLLALNTEHIFQGERARSYALYALLVTLLVLWCFAMKDLGRGRLYWLTGGAIMTLTVYTHYVGAIYVAGVVAAAALSDVPKPFKQRTFIAAAAAAVLFLPWLLWLVPAYAARDGVAGNLAWVPRPTPTILGYGIVSFLGTPPLRGVISSGLLLTGSLAAVAVWRGQRSIQTLSLAFAALGAPLALYGASLLGETSFFHIRHLLPSFAPWLLLISLGAAELGQRFPRPGLAFALLAGILLAFPLAAFRTTPFRRTLAPVARLLTEPPLHEMPAYAVGQYEIGEPINFHAGIERVRQAPREGLENAENAVLLYRADSAERDVARALETNCTTRSERLVGRDVTLAVLHCTGWDR